MKNLAVVIFAIILVALAYYAYAKYTPKTDLEREQERETALENQYSTKSRLTLEAYQKLTQNLRAGLVPLNYFSCPLDSDIWIATKINTDQVSTTGIERRMLLNKNDGEGLVNVALGGSSLWLNKANDVSKYNIVKQMDDRGNTNYKLGIVTTQGWLAIIDMQLTKFICVKKQRA